MFFQKSDKASINAGTKRNIILSAVMSNTFILRLPYALFHAAVFHSVTEGDTFSEFRMIVLMQDEKTDVSLIG